MILFLISLFHLEITNTTCPLAFKLLPYDKIEIEVPPAFPVSFQKDFPDRVYIEVSADKQQYGPYKGTHNVFGIYFKDLTSTITIINENPINSQIFIGCGNYLQTIYNGIETPSYTQNYVESMYPILFSDDQGISKVYEILLGIFMCFFFIASFVYLGATDGFVLFQD